MTTSPVTPQHEAALRLLVTVVKERLASGRYTHSAGLKPLMQQASNGGFSEGRLGFPSFRSFLEWAQQAGAVSLAPSLNGPDVEVFLGSPEPGTPGQSLNEKPRRGRIRADLWRCFVDWREDWRRVYDLDAHEASMFPREPHEVGDAPVHEALRMRVLANPDRFVEIPPIAQEAQIGWMRQFAQAECESDTPLQSELLNALSSPRPAQAFATRLRQSPADMARWNRFREDLVASVMEDWAKANQIAVPLFDEPRRVPSTEPLSLGEPTDIAALRARLHKAIDAMPLPELLRLSIPLEYLIQP